jgi:hypothetical protein
MDEGDAMRTMLAGLAVVAVTLVGMPAATAQDIPAYGHITITDAGLGPRATWTYDGVLNCSFTTNGPAGVASRATVTCRVPGGEGGGLATLNCPLMILSRTTLSVVGARASCGNTLDMGVGTTATASANLGHVYSAITCEAYMDFGVLVAPYTVTCNEPGLPTLDTSLASVATA